MSQTHETRYHEIRPSRLGPMSTSVLDGSLGGWRSGEEVEAFEGEG